jgi:FMN phosphatase YigB (HAD superfamily)
MNQIKAIIFDYGRTIHNGELGGFLPEARPVLEYLQKKYKLALVSVTLSESTKQRREKIVKEDFQKYFDQIYLMADINKDEQLDAVVKKWDLDYQHVAVVGDRMIREIKWGNKKGCTTVWLQTSKFANELPNSETGQPNFTIHNLNELLAIF